MELKGLNPAQSQAVKHDVGPALVVAGAGTGKTQVITRRIAHLIATGKAKPGEVLALTFTEKAAREMEERLYDLIGWRSFEVPILTFHAFGAELLGRFANHIGRSVGSGLLNDMQKSLLLQQHFSRAELSYYGPQASLFEFVEGVVGYIGQLQNAGVSAENYAEYAAKLAKDPGDMHPKDVAEQLDLSALYALYEAIKAETGTYDYNDLLEIPLRILQQKPNLAERLAAQYRYVLVDEYQDTNSLQDQLLRAFIPPGGNIFAVGDDDQAIYGFRGAQIDNILSFVDHFKVQQPLALVENYRSGQTILDAAYRLIQHNNPERLEAKLGLNKQLIAATTIEAKVSSVPYAQVSDEQEGVLAAIAERLASGVEPATIGVLAPTHAALKPIAKGLRARNLPFALSTQVNIFEQPELNQLWYLMQWIGQRADDEAIAHVLLSPFVGWKAANYRALLLKTREEHADLEEVIRATASEDNLAAQLMQRLDEWREWGRELPVSRLAYRLVFDTGVSQKLIAAAPKSGRIVRVFEDLHRLLGQMQDYETVAVDSTLVGYLQAFPKPPVLEVSEPLGDSEGVQLLTVHSAKGLEFDVVYLIGTTQRAWAGGGSRLGRYQVPEELLSVAELPPEHEQRRLMYVAVTRAKHELIISAATQTSGGTRQAVSPFVGELLPESQLETVADTATSDIDKSLRKLQRFFPLHQEASKERLPFETSDGWIELAVGSLGRYEFCPYDFYLENVLQIKQPFGPQLAFGNAIHACIQRFYDAQLRGEELKPGELDSYLDELWSSRGYETKELTEQACKLAHQTLYNFVARPEDSDRKILNSEMSISFEVPEAKLRLRGRIDAIFQTLEGIELRDFKTGRSKTDPEKLARDAKNSFQLRTYALAYEALNHETPAAVTLDYVVTDTVGSSQLTPTILKNHRAKLVQLAERIRSRDFAPQNTAMHQCASVRYYGTEDELDDLVEEGVGV